MKTAHLGTLTVGRGQSGDNGNIVQEGRGPTLTLTAGGNPLKIVVAKVKSGGVHKRDEHFCPTNDHPGTRD